MNAKIFHAAAAGEPPPDFSAMTELGMAREAILIFDGKPAGGTGPLGVCRCQFILPGECREILDDTLRAGSEIHLAVLFVHASSPLIQGPKGDFSIEHCGHDQAHEGSRDVMVIARLQKFDRWLSVRRE